MRQAKTRARRRRRATTGFRFPCGHVQGERATRRRLRTTDRAVWVACARCNVIALAVA